MLSGVLHGEDKKTGFWLVYYEMADKNSLAKFDMMIENVLTEKLITAVFYSGRCVAIDSFWLQSSMRLKCEISKFYMSVPLYDHVLFQTEQQVQ